MHKPPLPRGHMILFDSRKRITESWDQVKSLVPLVLHLPISTTLCPKQLILDILKLRVGWNTKWSFIMQIPTSHLLQARCNRRGSHCAYPTNYWDAYGNDRGGRENRLKIFTKNNRVWFLPGSVLESLTTATKHHQKNIIYITAGADSPTPVMDGVGLTQWWRTF